MDYLIIGVISLIIGTLFGAYVLPIRRSSTRLNHTDDPTVNTLKRSHRDYEHAVADHFRQTNTLLDDMQHHLQTLQTHLHDGAKTLNHDEGKSSLLEPSPHYTRAPARALKSKPMAKNHAKKTAKGKKSLHPPIDYDPHKHKRG